MVHPFCRVLLLSMVVILDLFLLHGVDSSAVPVPVSLSRMDYEQQEKDDDDSLPSRIVRAKLPTISQTSSSTASSSQAQAQLWMYRGALYDPMDGRTIATVQGLEVVRPVLNTSGLAIDDLLVQQKFPRLTTTTKKAIGGLQNGDVDQQDVMLSSTTLWSQKIFCYTTTNPIATRNGPNKKNAEIVENDDEEVLLTSVRIRPQSPRKILPLDQIVAIYETATTYISTKTTKQGGSTTSKESSGRNLIARRKSVPRQSVRPSFSTSSSSSSSTSSSPPPSSSTPSSSSSSSSTTDLVVHSEWPNGQTVWNTASTPKAAANIATHAKEQRQQQKSTIHHGGDVDFTVYAKLRSRASPNAVLPPRDLLYLPPTTPLLQKDGTKISSSSDQSSSVVVSPKRSTLVQFGASRMDENNKFGARETYAYRNVPPRPVASTPRRLSMEWWRRTWRWSPRKGRGATTTRYTSSPTLSYTRYGEGPPWFAPGRHCLLELQGRPIDSLSEATPVLQGLVAEGGPVVGFSWREQTRSVKNSRVEVEGPVAEPPTLQEAWGRTHRQRSSSSSSVARQLRSSTPGTGSRFRLQPQIDDTLDDATSAARGNPLPSYARAAKRGIIASWERVRAATVVLEAVGN